MITSKIAGKKLKELCVRKMKQTLKFKKFKFDSKSLIFKLWVYFALFAALLMIILWFLQIFFLRTYYEEMKIMETRRVANSISANYDAEDFSDIFTTAYNTSLTSDLFIDIEIAGQHCIFPPYSRRDDFDDLEGKIPAENSENFDQIKSFIPYVKEIQNVKTRLLTDPDQTTSIIIPDPRSYTNTLAYGAILDDTPNAEVILYVFSPLYPVDSTVDILANQLIYVTTISLVLAFVLSVYLSNRIAKPIRDITKSASKLAEGKYGITFEGGHYTEIIRLAETLTHTSKELAKADNLQKDLLANVSHDLRTPLTMVKSYAEMIRDLSGDDPVKRGKHLQVIIEEADRLNQLVGDMLMLSKMQSGVDALDFICFNLRETAENLLHSYDIFAEQEGFEISFVCEADVYVKGDENRIKQVLSNLLNNAIRYSGETKVIALIITETEQTVRCEINDSGQGIATEELKHIWERYYKASSNHSRNTQGSGLGLSIVKEILQLHHAKFGVQSELGKGSTFWFEMKKCPPDKDQSQEKHQKTMPSMFF